MASFYETVTAAIADFTENGFESDAQLDRWMTAIRAAAEADMISQRQLDRELQRFLISVYQRMVEKHGILRQHPGLERFTIDRLRPQLRAELDRRILTSADLIRLNREQVIAETLRRFQGWATSIPIGGSRLTRRQVVRSDIRKSMTSLPFLERRVLVDQGHKLNAAISDIIASDQNAIAAEWHSHWRQSGYQFREEHKERDQVVYATRGSWAIKRRFITAGEQGYYEDHERPGELVYCRCYVRWLYNLRDLPRDMLTEKGKEALAQVRARLNA